MYIRHHLSSHPDCGFPCSTCVVWCAEHRRVSEQPVPRLWGLVMKYVESCTCYASGLDCPEQCLLVNDRRSCDIYEKGIWAHLTKYGLTEHTSCFRCLGS